MIEKEPSKNDQQLVIEALQAIFLNDRELQSSIELIVKAMWGRNCRPNTDNAEQIMEKMVENQDVILSLGYGVDKKPLTGSTRGYKYQIYKLESEANQSDLERVTAVCSSMIKQEEVKKMIPRVIESIWGKYGEAISNSEAIKILNHFHRYQQKINNLGYIIKRVTEEGKGYRFAILPMPKVTSDSKLGPQIEKTNNGIRVILNGSLQLSSKYIR